MRIYNTLDVSLTFQNCGTVWLMVLRGSQEQIELAFNGLFNFNATSGKLEYVDHTKTVATFWSNSERMYKYFFNRHYLKFDSIKHADYYAAMQMAELQKHSHTFMDFHRVTFVDDFNISSASAEKPDTDFKDAVLLHAHEDKELAPAENLM